MNTNKIIYSILGVIFFFTMLSQCNSRNANKQSAANVVKLDSALTIINNIDKKTISVGEFNILLKIEGLKAENRMIQASDRRVIDMEKQTANDKEITELEAKLKTIK